MSLSLNKPRAERRLLTRYLVRSTEKVKGWGNTHGQGDTVSVTFHLKIRK